MREGSAGSIQRHDFELTGARPITELAAWLEVNARTVAVWYQLTLEQQE